jgi:signal transduction histidine kinase
MSRRRRVALRVPHGGALALGTLPPAPASPPAGLSRAGRVVLAITLPAAALAISMLIAATTGATAPMLPAVAAVLIVTSFAGFRAGIAATAVAITLHVAFTMSPLLGGTTASASDRLRVVLFALTGLLASGLAWLRSRAEARAAMVAADATRVRDRADLAARRLEALQALSTELVDAGTRERIVAVLLHQAARALRADEVAMWTVDAAGGAAVVIGSLRDGEVDALVGTSIPLEMPWPAAETARTGRSVFEEQVRTCETLPGAILPAVSAAAVPLAIDPSTPGVLSIAWSHANPLPSDRRLFILALARFGAAALERRELLAAEVAARQRAEAVTRHLHVLADAGRALGTTLDQDVMLRRLPALAVPHLGDVALVEVSLDGFRRRLASAGDPSLHDVAVALRRNAEADAGWLAVQGRDGRTAAMPVNDPVRASLARSPGEARALRGLDPHWVMEIPLRSQGRAIGQIVLLRRRDQPFDADELAAGDELGQRASRALENARMHRLLTDMARRDQRRAAELEAVLAAVEDGFVMTDADGRVRSANGAAMRLLGGPAPTLPLLLERVVDGNGRLPDLVPGTPVEVRRSGDPGTWLELARYEVWGSDQDDPASSVLVVRDVTAFRRVRALQEAFFSLLSHELRTPVTTIYAGASLLARRNRKLDPAAADEILTDMAGEADRLYRLVEDLMVLARFDASFVLGDQPVLLQHLVTRIVDQERGRWPAVQISATVDGTLPAVAGDETAISQVVRNLVSNAAKYSPVGGQVALAASASADGNCVVLDVHDEGPGVAPAEVERVFDPFYRSPITAGLAGGAGIGLYVSRRLAEAMGGALSARPAEGSDRGGRFRLLLPTYAGVDLDEPEGARRA